MLGVGLSVDGSRSIRADLLLCALRSIGEFVDEDISEAVDTHYLTYCAAAKHYD